MVAGGKKKKEPTPYLAAIQTPVLNESDLLVEAQLSPLRPADASHPAKAESASTHWGVRAAVRSGSLVSDLAASQTLVRELGR